MTRIVLLCLAAVLQVGCASTDYGTAVVDARIWHVKAIRSDGSFVDVKAIQPDGRILDVKALQSTDDLHLLDVKALRDGRRLDVKLLPAEGDRNPLRAIDADGTVLEIVALPPEGGRLPVAGVRRDGNILHVKAIAGDGSILGVKAISPEGHLMDVKGIALQDVPFVPEVHGVRVAAHVKALPQETGAADTDRGWNVRAIDPAGRTFPVQVVLADGASLEVEALESAGNRHVMDVKALRDGERIAIKVAFDPRGEGDVELGAVLPAVAITGRGEQLEVRARSGDGTVLPIHAIRRSGNVFDVKAIAPDGTRWGVKALSVEGFLHDVKGLKLTEEAVEGEIAGVVFHAHVKAVPQVIGADR